MTEGEGGLRSWGDSEAEPVEAGRRQGAGEKAGDDGHRGSQRHPRTKMGVGECLKMQRYQTAKATPMTTSRPPPHPSKR